MLDDAVTVVYNEAYKTSQSILVGSPGLKSQIDKFNAESRDKLEEIKKKISGIKGAVKYENTKPIPPAEYDDKLKVLIGLFNDITTQIERAAASTNPEHIRVIYNAIQVMIIQLQNLSVNYNNLELRMKKLENSKMTGGAEAKYARLGHKFASYSIWELLQRLKNGRRYSKKKYNKKRILRRNTPAGKNKHSQTKKASRKK